MSDGFWIGTVFCLYLLGMLGIGFYFYRRTKSISDYVLGGRRLNTWVTSMSAQASDMSGWLLLGLPGFAYASGMEAAWIALGLAVGTYINWKVIAQRLRVYTERAGDAITLPDFFENRFHEHTRWLRILSAAFILVFFLIYTASGFVAGAKLFGTVFGLNYHVALAIGALVIISYTFLGGFMAVSWTDFFQGWLMFAAVVTVPALGIMRLGGWQAFRSAISRYNAELLDPFTGTEGQALSVIAVVSLAAWGLGYFGQPHILARFMAIRKAGHIPTARRIAMVWVIISLGAAVLVGMVGGALLEQRLEGSAGETVFMRLVETMFHPLMAGVLLAAILAAIMSTADSQLLVSSSALTEDIYKVWIRPKASQSELVWVSRCTVILVALLAAIIAWDPGNSVLGLVAYAWGGFGATFGPIVILSLFWRRMTARGALAGILAGGVTVLVWKHLQGGLFDVYEIVPGFLLSILAIVIVSLLDTMPKPQVLATFDSIRAQR